MALVDPQAYFFSEETQALNNRLPQWHKGRRLRDSNWAQLTSVFDGMGLEDYKTEERRALRNLFIQTAHLDEPDLLGQVQLPEGTSLTPKENNVNLLRNGSFESRARIDRVGDYWEHSGTVAVLGGALFGGRTPALTPTASETVRISQTVRRDPWNSGESRSFSAWYRIPTWVGGTIPSTSHGLLVIVTYGDGSTQTFRAAFAVHTSDAWRRIMLTVTPTRPVVEYTVRFETIRSAIFNISVPIRLDAVQAQRGSEVTTYEDNLNDQPNWFRPRLRSPIGFDTTVPVFVTPAMREFYYEAVPTRVQLFRQLARASSADRRGGVGQAVDFYRQRWAFTWTVNTVTNKIQRIGLNPQDDYGSFDLAFFTGTSTGPKFEDAVSGVTFRSLAGFQRWLWVIHQAPDLNGNIVMALSIVDPRVPFPAPAYYEAVQTLQLPLPTGLDYLHTEFRFEDPQHLYVQTSTQEYVLRLFYDYAIIDAESLRVFFRERYDSIALTR